jgi:hypothetical protein
LEAEMKRTLADTNASLTAFIVQFNEFRQVPHSAFHSLEYTHMRAILSQLKDDTWFKTFSDLIEKEHETMDRLLQKFWRDGKWFRRELVVLKIMQQNRFNAWMRVIEECMGLQYTKPHHENYRILLAIVREKECDPDHIIASPNTSTSAKVMDYYDPPQVPRIPDPFPAMRDDKLLVDLDKVNATLGLDSSTAFRGSPPSFNTNSIPAPPPGWIGPIPSAWSSNRNGPLSPTSNVNMGHTEVMPQNAISEEAAREALTTFGAYTLRPALVQQLHTSPLTHPPTPTWSRCFLTREHEETKVLLQRIGQFRSRGVSIIDLKLQLTEPQAAQLANIIQELNQLEPDNRFEHKMVELSMVNREHGIVTKQTTGTNIDVIHAIVQRAPKQGVNALSTYHGLMRRGPPPRQPGWSGPRGPPPPPPVVVKKEPDIIIIDEPRKKPSKGRNSTRNSGRRFSILSSSSESDSDSSAYTVSTFSSGGYLRKNRYGSRFQNRRNSSSDDSDDSSSEEVLVARWKVDPVSIRFSQKQKGRDVVQLLLERWTRSGDGKGKEKDEEKEERKSDRKKKTSRRVIIEEDSESADD